MSEDVMFFFFTCLSFLYYDGRKSGIAALEGSPCQQPHHEPPMGQTAANLGHFFFSRALIPDGHAPNAS
jgi:hypothetical protein